MLFDFNLKIENDHLFIGVVDANDLVTRENIEKKLNLIGRKIAKDYGHRVKNC